MPEGLKVHGVAEAQQETTLDLSARHWYKVDQAPKAFLKEVMSAISDSYESEE